MFKKKLPYKKLPAFCRGKFMSAIMVQNLELGLYASTHFRASNPSKPPTTYRTPSKTPTPAPYRRTYISVTGVHVSKLGL